MLKLLRVGGGLTLSYDAEMRLCSIHTTCASGDYRSCLGGFEPPIAPQPGASPSSPGTFPISEPAPVAPLLCSTLSVLLPVSACGGSPIPSAPPEHPLCI